MKEDETLANLELGLELLPEELLDTLAAKEYWQRFQKTGNITDYLSYAAFSKES